MKKIVGFLTVLFFVFLSSSFSFAVPQFSRIMKENCSYCHTNWPQLNNYGKEFLKRGFPGFKTSEISEDLEVVKALPIGLRINYRAIDKRTAKNSKKDELSPKQKQLKLRGLHELEILIAGSFPLNSGVGRIAYFSEIEFEDEFPGYEGRVVNGYINAVINPMFNVAAGYMSPFFWDGNNTVNRKNAVRYKWVGRKFVPSVSQGISVFGSVGKLGYGIAYHANSKDLEGHDPEGQSARVVINDIFNIVSVGAFTSQNKVYDGDTGVSSENDDRSGIDANIEVGYLSAQMLFAQKEGDKKTDYVQSYSVGVSLGDVVLTSVYDTFTKKGSNWGTGGAFLTAFLSENLKVQCGVEGTVFAPSSYKHKERRYTLAFDLGL